MPSACSRAESPVRSQPTSTVPAETAASAQSMDGAEVRPRHGEEKRAREDDRLPDPHEREQLQDVRGRPHSQDP